LSIGQLPVQLAHLRGRNAQPVDGIALGSRRAPYRAGHRRVPTRVAQAAHRGMTSAASIRMELLPMSMAA